MEATTSHDPDQYSAFYAPLQEHPSSGEAPAKPLKEPSTSPTSKPAAADSFSKALPRGVAEGVSAKSNPSLLDLVSFNWTNAMFSWQRTAYHFQPQKNWMNGR
ncbi:hypothetical protein PTKIN_Ptkin04bG0004700 [Pterospermum kingtungense]